MKTQNALKHKLAILKEEIKRLEELLKNENDRYTIIQLRIHLRIRRFNIWETKKKLKLLA